MLLSSLERIYLYTDNIAARSVSLNMRYTNWLNTVSRSIQNYLNRELEKKSRTVYFDSIYKKQEYFVKAYPIDETVAITIKIDRFGEFNGNETILDDDQVRIGKDSNSIIIDNNLGSGLKVIQATYTGGLAAHGTQSIFGIKNAVGGSITAGKYVLGGTSGSWGIVRAISSTSITIEVLSGCFEDEEVLTEYASLTATAGSKTVQIDSVTSRCLAETYPEIVTACEMQIAFMAKHHENGDFDLTGVSNEGVSYRRNSDKPYNLEPEVRLLIDDYINEVF